MSDWEAYPHRRLNPLTGEWVLVSPHRTARPWLGSVEKPPATPDQPYDPECYLCPGNARAGGNRNPLYTGIFRFTNDYPALLPDSPLQSADQSGLLVAEPERGVCRVVCFSPRHELTLARLPLEAIAGVVNAWQAEDAELHALPFVKYVQIFENRGALMGASNPHPHCQIWASASVPNEVRKEDAAQRGYRRERNRCLLCSYLSLEAGGPRVVYENSGFAVLVPFWAVWPFETLLLAKPHIARIDQISRDLSIHLADALKQIATRYDNLFEAPFPYTMGFHQQPGDADPEEAWHLHAHFYPPLLRSATVRKFMVGYELLAMPQRDLTAESAAERLRSLPEIHYLDR